MNIFDNDQYSQLVDQIFTPEREFLTSARAGYNVFLTGAAGTGKSTLLREFIEDAPRGVSITAPTGIAAINIGGMTTHRWCGMLLGPQNGTTNEEWFKHLQSQPYRSIKAGFNRVKYCECLVIDEISMLPGRQFDFVEWLFRHLRGNEEPFGGCQVIVIGDFLQLPPVRTDASKPYDWVFSSESWVRAEFKTVKLTTVRRQDEHDFVNALMRFRVGDVFGKHADLLRSRVKNFPPSTTPRIVTHNAQKDKWDNFQLENLPSETTTIEAQFAGRDEHLAFFEKALLTPRVLKLKPNARVMFTINRTVDGQTLYVNGQMGTVREITQDLVCVETDSGEFINTERYSWKYDANDPDTSTFSQFPLCLAWALTIHKSQGLTLDRAHIDCRAAREPGQAYVAVSRIRTLDGLSFKEWPKGIIVSNQALDFYNH